MSRYINADNLFRWGQHKLSDAVKYGNTDGAQQHFSYGTLMMYEIADEIDDAPGFEADISLDRLRELVEADEDGRCVVLPCKVGDTVYKIAQGMSLYKPGLIPYVVEVEPKSLSEICQWVEDGYYLGKTVFLARAEAEAALKGAEHE